MGKSLIRWVATGAFALTVTGAVPATAHDGGAAAGGLCTQGSVWALKAVEYEHRIVLTYGVHTDAAGEVWRVRIGHNGEPIFRGLRTTNDNGNFVVRLRTWNAVGIDAFRARAVNVTTEEVCAGGLAV
jgi:hypothetical protein